ncbi:MAG: hypothetical protein H7833_12665 [Magnetococcus sp. DMHC-1]|nr:hypothetical protein [Magnetococcales bacterium]
MAFPIQDAVGQGLIQQMGSSRTKMNGLFRQLASGNRINQAQDGPGLMNMIDSMTREIRGNNQALGNVNEGISVTQVADAGMGQIGDGLQRLRELAVQSANGTLSSADRTNLQAEAQQIQSQINDVVTKTSYNGQDLLGTGQTLTLQTGAGAADQTALDLPNLSAAFPQVDLSTQAGAASAISSIDTSLDTLNQARGQMGAAQSGLESRLSSLQSTNGAVQGARATIQETDYGQATAGLVSSMVKQRFGAALQGQMNRLSANSLNLLQ